MSKQFNLLFLIFVFIALQNTFGQLVADSSKIWRIETIDGSEFLGIIIQTNQDTVYLKNQSIGTIAIPKYTIVRFKELIPTQYKYGQVWDENVQSNRYFWAPNGYGLRKGEGYYQNVWVMFNQASYGVTNNFSLGVGMIPLFLFAGSETPIWFTPKISVPIVDDKFNVGGGLLVGTIVGANTDPFGIAYGVGTLGNRDANISFGLGYGFIGGDWSKQPVFELSALARISSKSYLITENYYIKSEGQGLSIISVGGRTTWTKVSVDYGLVMPLSEDIGSLIAIPWLGFVLPFGK